MKKIEVTSEQLDKLESDFNQKCAELKAATDEVSSLKSKLEENQKSASAPAPVISDEGAQKIASRLIERGILDEKNSKDFCAGIQSDPDQLVESFDKVAEFAGVSQVGEPAELQGAVESSQLDPIAAFAMGQ